MKPKLNVMPLELGEQMLQVYSLMFIYNKIIEGTDTGICAAAYRRLGKHKYAVNAMLKCEDIKPVKSIGHFYYL